MATIDSLALMREATRRVEARFQGALLVQMTADSKGEVPNALRFWFNTNLSGTPNVRTAIINYFDGKWGIIETNPENIVGLMFNDLLRIEIGLSGAVGYIRDSGYTGPLFFGGLLQPLIAQVPPNPLYNFTPTIGSGEFVFVDAVTGAVTWQKTGLSASGD